MSLFPSHMRTALQLPQVQTVYRCKVSFKQWISD